MMCEVSSTYSTWMKAAIMAATGTILFFWKFCFSLRASYKRLIWCTNYLNVHSRTFCKRWSFIWRCFFPVSILNMLLWIYASFDIYLFVYMFLINCAVFPNDSVRVCSIKLDVGMLYMKNTFWNTISFRYLLLCL